MKLAVQTLEFHILYRSPMGPKNGVNANCTEIGGSAETSFIGAVTLSMSEYEEWYEYLDTRDEPWVQIFENRKET